MPIFTVHQQLFSIRIVFTSEYQSYGSVASVKTAMEALFGQPLTVEQVDDLTYIATRP